MGKHVHNNLFMPTHYGNIGIGTATPTEGYLAIHSPDASGQACLKLQQLDVDQGFILFDANTAATADLLSAVSSFTTSVVTEHLRVQVDLGSGPVTRWIALSTTPTA